MMAMVAEGYDLDTRAAQYSHGNSKWIHVQFLGQGRYVHDVH
jgi:hypothetical protein